MVDAKQVTKLIANQTYMPHYYYVYMSSDGPQKRHSLFWRHYTVRFTCLKVIHVWQTRQLTSTVQPSEQRVAWSWKACTLMNRFHEFGNCCSCLSWSWCCELWIMLHTVKSIHSRRALTFTACVDVTCAKLQSYKFHAGFLSTMLKNILEITA